MIHLVSNFETSHTFFTERLLPKEIKELIIHSEDWIAEDLEFSCQDSGVCMIFNNGNTVTLNAFDKGHRLLFREHNIMYFISGKFSLKVSPNSLVHLIVIPLALFEHAIKHFGLPANSLNKNSFEMLFPSNLYTGEEISRNLHAFREETILPAGAGVYTYGRLLIFLSLQLSQYSAIKANHKKGRNKEDLSAEMYRVEQILRSDFHSRITIKNLAKVVGTNEFYLKQHFKRIFGLPVFSYRTKLRMETANNLLLNTAHSIEDISKKLGYKYTTHFITSYKKYYKVTPGDIRRKSI